MSQEHLLKLQDWVDSTGLLFTHIRWNTHPSGRGWSVRIAPIAAGVAHSLRSLHGPDLEKLCEEILPLAQQQFEQRKNSLVIAQAAHNKRIKKSHYADMREIENMHHTADDF